MRLKLIAFFIALIAVPVAQVVADTRKDGTHLYIWNGHFHSHTITLSKHQHSKALNYLFAPQAPPQKQKIG